MPSRTAATAARVMPSGLPTTSPRNIASISTPCPPNAAAERRQVSSSCGRDDRLLSIAGMGVSVSRWDEAPAVAPGAEAALSLALDPPDSGNMEVWVDLYGHAGSAGLAARFQLVREHCVEERLPTCPNPDGCSAIPAPECAFVPRRGCLAVSADVCQRSDVCEAEGACGFDGQKCTATRAEECARSSMCTYGGRCHLVAGECRALYPRDCERSCRTSGSC